MNEYETTIAILKKGGISRDVGILRAAIDNNAGDLKIVSAYTPEGSEQEQYTDYDYTYTTENFTSEIKTSTTVSGVTTTNTKTFSKTIVTAAYDPYGKQILRTEWNRNTGEITGYFDADGKEIHLEEWRV